nr:transmembrane 9 superfamily member 1-like [Ipomoea batatas]
MYSRNGGKTWIKSMVLTASLFPFMCFGIGFVLNTVAIFYGSLAAIPFGTIVVVFVIWAFISFPLALLGTVVGRNWSGTPNNPCRVKTIPRPIPEKKWYLTPSIISLMGGLLPFGSIFIEMYFVFTSFWNYKVYYVYGFMLLVFIILIIVTVCVTIVGTYFLLNAENYHWQWTSFFSAASTALYVYLYSIYYYHVKTKMSGFFQTSFYFGYTLMFCLGLGILCGSRYTKFTITIISAATRLNPRYVSVPLEYGHRLCPNKCPENAAPMLYPIALKYSGISVSLFVSLRQFLLPGSFLNFLLLYRINGNSFADVWEDGGGVLEPLFHFVCFLGNLLHRVQNVAFLQPRFLRRFLRGNGNLRVAAVVIVVVFLEFDHYGSCVCIRGEDPGGSQCDED